MKRGILFAACLVALSACSADSSIENALQEKYEQALAEGNNCLASAVAAEIVRATDTSDNRRPSISQASRWEKWGGRAEENAAKCAQAYEQAVAAGDDCAAARAAESYGLLLQMQFASSRGNMSRDQALQVADLQAKVVASGEKCRTGSSSPGEHVAITEEDPKIADDSAEIADREILNDGVLAAPVEDQSSAGVFMDAPYLGSEANTEQMAVTRSTKVFQPQDTVYLQLTTRTSSPSEHTLTVKWTFSHQGEEIPVHEESKPMIMDGSGSTLFQISKPVGWPVGQYTAPVQLDGKTRYVAPYTVTDAIL